MYCNTRMDVLCVSESVRPLVTGCDSVFKALYLDKASWFGQFISS